jgi:hypothetical protein
MGQDLVELGKTAPAEDDPGHQFEVSEHGVPFMD